MDSSPWGKKNLAKFKGKLKGAKFQKPETMPTIIGAPVHLKVFMTSGPLRGS